MNKNKKCYPYKEFCYKCKYIGMIVAPVKECMYCSNKHTTITENIRNSK